MLRGFDKGCNTKPGVDVDVSVMFHSLGKKNTNVMGPSSAPNAKGKAKANEGGGTIFGAQHCMTRTL
jgi:hypothetical protein